MTIPFKFEMEFLGFFVVSGVCYCVSVNVHNMLLSVGG